MDLSFTSTYEPHALVFNNDLEKMPFKHKNAARTMNHACNRLSSSPQHTNGKGCDCHPLHDRMVNRLECVFVQCKKAYTPIAKLAFLLVINSFVPSTLIVVLPILRHEDTARENMSFCRCWKVELYLLRRRAMHFP